MNLKHLEIFKAVLETGSTIAASTQLGLSQSAISRQLAALEEEIGRELFVREKGRLRPRPEAHLLVGEIEEVSQSIAKLKTKIGDLRTGVFGEALIRVAFPHSLSTTMLPPIVAEFKKLHPRVTVEILSGPYSAIEQMVRGRMADLGFVRFPTEEPGFTTKPLYTSGTTCVMPTSHSLAAKDAIDVNDLARNDLILLGRQRINRNELEHELRRMVPTYRCSLEVHSVETACACAARGLGIAIVPTLIANFFRSEQLVMRPFLPDKRAEYGIITRSEAPLSWSCEAFIEVMRRESEF
ncbi:LysR family transcriptional regulator [Rhizobium oryzicola]|uniref:LysR family transcriptional regulator n=1 Tax=Rhizobium oryzicola TaxID=1232668 RepID=A0ABT8SX17_9HYPH|nr:LysR family transcriptional regulator [Rhizobium oryzicola]MDO1583004.1 LysR family transcriptional regulator [Rhizobium oryzicola]